MNNKTIIEFGCRVIWRILEISEGVTATDSTDNTLLDLHNSSQDTQPHSLIINFQPFSFSFSWDKFVPRLLSFYTSSFWRYLWRERPKNFFFLFFEGHIHGKRNFCLLAEEFPFILLTNPVCCRGYLMYFRVSIQVLFISKTFQYFHVSIPQASCYGYS